MSHQKPGTSKISHKRMSPGIFDDIIDASDDETQASTSRKKSQTLKKLQKSQRINSSLRKNLLKRSLESPASSRVSKKPKNVLDDSLFINDMFKEPDAEKTKDKQDAADYLTLSQQNEFIVNDPFAELNTTQKKTNTDLDEFGFTQYCNNTQFMGQIEAAIGKINLINKSQPFRNISNTPHINNTPSIKKTDRLNASLKEALSSVNMATPKKIAEPFDTTFNDALCDLFRSTQYRKEIEDGFDNIEKSICVMGQDKLDDEFNLTVNESIFKQHKMETLLEKTFKSPQVMKMILQHANESVNLNKEQIEWTDETFANAVFQDGSITNMLRTALKDNLNQSVVNNIVDNTQEKGEFVTYGDFFGLPDRVQDLFKVYRRINKLYDWQIECLNLPAISQRKNLIYALPTSGGKTLVAEILILREILCRKKNAMFILPYVAIVQEKVWGMSPFAVALEFLVEEYAGGKGNYPPRQRRRKNCVYICTIEKALGVMNSLIENDRSDEIGLVVIDELHLLGDGSRGAILETLLTKIKSLNCKIQMIGMSATIGNIPELCEFLNADVYSKDFRPVELLEYVKCRDEIAIVNKQCTDPSDILLHEKTVDYYKNDKDKQLNKIDPDHLGGLVMDVIPDASCLVFCKTRLNCESVAKLLCKVIDQDLKNYRLIEKRHLKSALKEDAGTLCKVLAHTLDYGIAYHHSGLTSEERRLIEEAFRRGIIAVICCTSTLAAGVNLPAKRVIIRNPYIGREFINLSRYKQMAGRAGRAGYGEKGESIIICTPQELPRIRELFLSPMDIASSSMHANDCDGLQNFLLSCVSLKLASTKTDLHNMVERTLLAVQSKRLGVDVRLATRQAIKMLFKTGALNVTGLKTQCILNKSISAELESTLPTQKVAQPSQCSDAGSNKQKTVIHVNNSTPLQISKLGSAAIRGGLDLTKAHMLYEDLLRAQASLVLFTGLHLMYLVTPYSIVEQVNPDKPMYYSLYQKLNEREAQTAKVLGFNDAIAAKMLTNRKITELPERVLNRFYVTLMLYDLWNGMSVYEVSLKYDVNRGIIQNLMTNAASFASNVYHFCGEFEDFWAFSLLLKGMADRLSHCCVKELVPLMKLPSVKQNRAKQLFKAGYKTLQSVARAEPEKLMSELHFMSKTLANQLIAAAKMILLEKVENLREEAEEVLEGVNLAV